MEKIKYTYIPFSVCVRGLYALHIYTPSLQYMTAHFPLPYLASSFWVYISMIFHRRIFKTKEEKKRI